MLSQKLDNQSSVDCNSATCIFLCKKIKYFIRNWSIVEKVLAFFHPLDKTKQVEWLEHWWYVVSVVELNTC